MVLRRKNIATCPTYFCSELDKSFNKNSSLDRHVQRTRYPSSGEWLYRAVLFAQRPKAWHFVFCKMDFFATKWRKAEIGDAIITTGGKC